MAIATMREAGPRRGEAWRAELGPAFNRLTPEGLEDQAPVRQAPTDLLKICLQVRGRAIVHQVGDEVVVEPGQMALYETGRPTTCAWKVPGPARCWPFPVPRSACQALRGRRTDARPAADLGCGAVLAGFATSAVLQRDAIPGGVAERLGEAGLHLVAGALSGRRHRPVRRGRPRPTLPGCGCWPTSGRISTTRACPPAQVAAAHHMAPRTLSRLFEHEPTSVAGYIRTDRLHTVRRDLGDPLLARRSIAAIAARWCFVEQAHFTRAYRAKFGATPSASRRALIDGAASA